MPKIGVNFNACDGHANCAMAAPDVFALGDDGYVALLREEINEDERDRVEEATRTCPKSALWIDD